MYEGEDAVAYLKASTEFHVTDMILGPGSVAVTAAAGTGWRYDVVVSLLPRQFAGGQYVITVLSPWTSAYCVGDPFGLRPEKVAEVLGGDSDYLRPADVAAVTMTINYALQKLRDHYLPREKES